MTSTRISISTMATLTCLIVQLCLNRSALAEDPTGRFTYQLDGTLDTETGLVWSFGLMESLGTSASWDWAQDVAAPLWYPPFSAAFVASYYEGELESDWLFDNWRVPSKEELSRAVNDGLFFYHNLDPANPLDSKIDQNSPNSNGRWTSSSKGNRGYVVNFWSGQIELVGKSSALNVVFVRNIDGSLGGGDDTGGGGGGGKGNKK